MDIEKIKTLTELMVDNDLSEIVFREGEDRIMLRRAGAQAPASSTPPPMQMAAPAPAPQPAAAPAPMPVSAPVDAGMDSLESPMVGTFYTSSDPDSPPFVKVGDKVTPDTVICIIEAMKVFNEIKAEKTGTITSIDVSNGAAVEFGQSLMKIRVD